MADVAEDQQAPPGHWRSMALTNLRLFANTDEIRLAPITIIFGKNSSGKTTLLRAPLLLRQLLTEQSATGEAPLAGPLIDFGMYKDVVRHGDLRRDVTLEFRLANTTQGRPFFRGELADNFSGELSVRTVLHWNKRSGRAQIQSVSFIGKDDVSVDIVREGPSSVRLEIPAIGYSAPRDGVSEISLRTFEFLTFLDREPDRASRDVSFLIYGLSNVLQFAVRSLSYIPPIREMPERVYRLDRAASSSRLGAETVTTLVRSKIAVDQVAESLRRLEIADDLSVTKSAPGFVNLVLTMPESRQRVNLADVGFGASQALPILVALATTPTDGTILIEQPELHLHPQAQVVLTDILIEASLGSGVQLILESHSEHMFLRLRRRVAEGKLDATQLAAYVVDEGKVREVVIDSNGGIVANAFPPGFFEEEWAEALALARAGSQTAS